jgi:hypothetical protein
MAGGNSVVGSDDVPVQARAREAGISPAPGPPAAARREAGGRSGRPMGLDADPNWMFPFRRCSRHMSARVVYTIVIGTIAYIPRLYNGANRRPFLGNSDVFRRRMRHSSAARNKIGDRCHDMVAINRHHRGQVVGCDRSDRCPKQQNEIYDNCCYRTGCSWRGWVGPIDQINLVSA